MDEALGQRSCCCYSSCPHQQQTDQATAEENIKDNILFSHLVLKKYVFRGEKIFNSIYDKLSFSKLFILVILAQFFITFDTGVKEHICLLTKMDRNVPGNLCLYK